MVLLDKTAKIFCNVSDLKIMFQLQPTSEWMALPEVWHIKYTVIKFDRCMDFNVCLWKKNDAVIYCWYLKSKGTEINTNLICYQVYSTVFIYIIITITKW